jgi:ArsR family transcriptional regulator
MENPMNDPAMREIFRLQAEICKTLADPNRLMLLHELREGERSVSQLMEMSGLPQSNVSRHLAVLRERSLVTTRREGTTIYYRMANEKIGQACDMVREVLQTHLTQNRSLANSINSMS